MKDIKIKDAVFFPEPQSMYRELPISKTMGAEAQEYMKAWEFNGLLVFASVAEYDDGREWLHISLCEDCPCFYKTEGAFKDKCQLTHKEIENYFIIDKSCPLKEGK